MQIFACTKHQNEKNDAPKRKSKTKPRNKIRNKNSKQIKHCNELKKPRDLLVARLFILKDFIAFPSVWRGGKKGKINTLGS